MHVHRLIHRHVATAVWEVDTKPKVCLAICFDTISPILYHTQDDGTTRTGKLEVGRHLQALKVAFLIRRVLVYDEHVLVQPVGCEVCEM